MKILLAGMIFVDIARLRWRSRRLRQRFTGKTVWRDRHSVDDSVDDTPSEYPIHTRQGSAMTPWKNSWRSRNIKLYFVHIHSARGSICHKNSFRPKCWESGGDTQGVIRRRLRCYPPISRCTELSSKKQKRQKYPPEHDLGYTAILGHFCQALLIDNYGFLQRPTLSLTACCS